MMFPWIVGLGTLAFTATFALSFRVSVGPEENSEGNRQLEDCTEHAVSACYMEITMNVPWDQLHPNDNGEFNEEAYREACKSLTETSRCYEAAGRCPASIRSNFTRREEGYRAFRAVVCDGEALKGMVTAKNCTNNDKAQECIREELGSFSVTAAESEEIYCRVLPLQTVCFEKARNAHCPMRLESLMAIVNKTVDALELAYDCKSMYPNRNNGANASRSNALTFSELAADVAEIKAVVRENAQAIASLAGKQKQQAASVESINGALDALRGEFSRRCGTPPDAPEIGEGH